MVIGKGGAYHEMDHARGHGRLFASCEQAINPKLKGKPIGVMADPYGRGKKRSVIAAASYEAKRKGVKAGMPPREAFNLCPDLILVQAHPSFYGYVHNQMLNTQEAFLLR